MRHAHFLRVLLALISGLGLVKTATAQDSTVEATPGGPSEGYPIAIHEGTCNNPVAEPAWQIDDAVSIGVDQEEPEVIGLQASRVVTEATGTVDVSLDDLGGSEHVVAVHASPDEFGTLVACGHIAGIKDDGQLVIALAPVGESEVSGIAVLQEDGDQTELTVYVVPPSDEAEGTPAG